MNGAGHARLIGTVRDERAEHPETLKFEDVSRRAIQNMKVEVKQVSWFSTYRVITVLPSISGKAVAFSSATRPTSIVLPAVRA